jgi:cytochrome c oxidase assembly protein subunit 15
MTAVIRAGDMALLRSHLVLRRLALASVIANVGIVVTGGAVRLTGSGLGCPTWPRCTDSSFVPDEATGYHVFIEFGNRMLGGVVGVIAVAGLVVALFQRPRRRRQVLFAALTLAGVLSQGLLGGITVLTGLNPWVVGAHFLLSLPTIATAYAFWLSTRDPERLAGWPAPPAVRHLGAAVVAASLLTLALGTVVTGSGPHAGDAQTARNGLDPETVSQLHVDAVFLLIGLSLALWFALRAVDAPAAPRRAAGVLILVELAQGVIGYVQYFTGVPAILVGLHMAGACALWLATLAVWHATRPAPAPLGRADVEAQRDGEHDRLVPVDDGVA